MGALTFFLIAGEPSGDSLGAALMAGLKTLHPDVRFQGVGGPLMQAEGLTSLYPMQELSLMGVAEVLPKAVPLLRRVRETAEAALAASPAALITIDSPDFCLRVAKKVKAAKPHLRTIHYVAPSVWAWRPGRAAKMAKVIDHVLALLPFEPPWMTAAGMTCDFVGHPVVSEPLASPQERAVWDGPRPLVLALPGSRRGEITRLAPRFGAALGLLAQDHPGLRVALPTLASIEPHVRDLTRAWPIRPEIITDPAARRGAFAAADVALAASGTVSLQLAANGVPMVIGYDMNPISMWLARRLVKSGTVTLVNLVSDTRAVPELLGHDCTPEALARTLRATLNDPQSQRSAMALTMDRLGRGGEPPGLRAARSVLAHLAPGLPLENPPRT